MMEVLKRKLMVFIGVETSGPDPEKHEIVEFSAIFGKQNGEGLHLVGAITGAVKPVHLETADKETLKNTTFNQKVWSVFARDLKTIMTRFVDKMGDTLLREKLDGVVLIAHGMAKKSEFLGKAFREADLFGKINFDVFDIMDIADQGGFGGWTFDMLCAYFGVPDGIPPHRAQKDAYLAFSVFNGIMNDK